MLVALSLALSPALAAKPQAPAPSGPPSEAQVRELLELTGAAQMGQQVMSQLVQQFKAMPGLPPGFLDQVQKQTKPDDLVNLIIPIYEKNLTAADVDAAIVFYKSPAGRNFTAALPQ